MPPVARGQLVVLLPLGSAYRSRATCCFPSLPKLSFPRPSPQDTPAARLSPILQRQSRPLFTALRRAASRSSEADAACWAARERGVSEGGRQRRGWGMRGRRGGVKRTFVLPIRPCFWIIWYWLL